MVNSKESYILNIDNQTFNPSGFRVKINWNYIWCALIYSIFFHFIFVNYLCFYWSYLGVFYFKDNFNFIIYIILSVVPIIFYKGILSY